MILFFNHTLRKLSMTMHLSIVQWSIAMSSTALGLREETGQQANLAANRYIDS